MQVASDESPRHQNTAKPPPTESPKPNNTAVPAKPDAPAKDTYQLTLAVHDAQGHEVTRAIAGSVVTLKARVTRAADGQAMAGVPVGFVVAKGAPTVTAAAATTDDAGEIAASWTLGAAVGPGTHEITAATGGDKGANVASARAILETLDPVCGPEPTHAVFQKGAGTADDPFIVCTPAQLMAFAQTPAHWGDEIRLAADIDMSAYDASTANLTWPGIGTLAAPFTGRLDGDGHVIAHLRMVSQAAPPFGFIVYASGAKIAKLSLDDARMTIMNAGADWGLLMGRALNVDVTDVSVTGGFRVDPSVTNVVHQGGIAGRLNGDAGTSTIARAKVDVSIRAVDNAAPVTGDTQALNGGSIVVEDVVARGDVANIPGFGNTFGGFIAYARAFSGASLVVRRSVTFANVTTLGGRGSWSGGGIGDMQANGAGSTLTVEDFAAHGDIATDSNFICNTCNGGLVGSMTAAAGGVTTLQRAAAYGTVRGVSPSVAQNKMGAFVGVAGPNGAGSGVVIQDSFARGNVLYTTSAAHASGGAFVGEANAPAGTTLTIARCYAVGTVTGSTAATVAGFVGNVLNTPTFTNVFWNASLNAKGQGNGADPLAAQGKTSAQLKTQATFTGFDFTTVWDIAEGSAYPTLRSHAGFPTR